MKFLKVYQDMSGRIMVEELEGKPPVSHLIMSPQVVIKTLDQGEVAYVSFKAYNQEFRSRVHQLLIQKGWEL